MVEINFSGDKSEEPPTTVHMEDGQPYTLDSEGVTKGIQMIPFHWRNRQTGKPVPVTFFALGKRNLEFRRAEAEKAGYEFVIGHHNANASE
jgi:hypothetical protein